MGAIISRVDPQGVAARYGFLEGDEIITINGQLLRDIIDYYFLTSEHRLEINFVRDGFPRTTVVHKAAEESLGLDFSNEVFDGIMPCRYKCMFCFVDQMPRGMRRTLYVKDDDYRLSFLHGNYITLTSLAENDLRRITALRLSPLYVSVHATDPQVRSKMMGSSQAGNIMKMLNKLKLHGIQCHTQIVVVPRVNDGEVLKKTLKDLFDLYGTVLSVAVVPVGLTKHRKGVAKIKPFTKKDAQSVYNIVSKFQKKAMKKYKTSLFFLADEIYLLMDMDFPPHSHYEDYPQLGNGVGLVRKMITDFNRRKRFFPTSLPQRKNIWIVTGVLGEKAIKPMVDKLNSIRNLEISLVTVKNDFFGRKVTVTGLLTGQDIHRELRRRLRSGDKPDNILLPDILLRENKFLDDVVLWEVGRSLGVKITPVRADAIGLIQGVLGDKWRESKKRGSKKKKGEQKKESPLAPVTEDLWVEDVLQGGSFGMDDEYVIVSKSHRKVSTKKSRRGRRRNSRGG